MNLGDFLSKDNIDIINIVSLSIGLLSILLAVTFYFKSKRTKIISYAKRSYRIITNRFSNIEGVKVLLFDKEVETVTSTRIAIWNGGSKTIYDTDVATLNPIIVSAIDNERIYKSTIIEVSNDSSNISMSEVQNQPNAWKLDFEYIDPGDGAVIEIIHNGTEESDFSIDGKLKGGKLRKSLETKEEDQNPVPVGPGMATIPSFTPSFFKFAGYLSVFFMSPIFLIVGIFTKEGFWPCFLFFALGLLLLILSRYFYPKFNLKRFEDFKYS